MKLKLLGLILTALVVLSGIAGMVLAGSPSDVQFLKLEINDDDVSNGETIYVERGDYVDISIQLKALSIDDVENLKVRAWLGGYEDEVEDVSRMFDLVSNAARTIDLDLELPNDMSASKPYALHVEVYNADGSKEYTANLGQVRFQIEEERHKLRVQDVIYSSSVKAGSMLYTKVRIENVGAKDEKDIKVSVSIPELGVSTRDYIDELVCEEVSNNDRTSESIELGLRMPNSVVTDDYELQIDIEYNNGRELTTVTRLVHVDGIAAGAGEMVISIDTMSQDIAKGAEAGYKLMFANLGNSLAMYSVEVEGADAWADVKVKPSFVSLNPGEAGEVMVYLTADENAIVGDHTFSLRVNLGDVMVKEMSLSANVVDESFDMGSLKTGLEVGFAILVILLVILGLIVAFYKIGGKKEEAEKPSEPEESLGEETYY